MVVCVVGVLFLEIKHNEWGGARWVALLQACNTRGLETIPFIVFTFG